MYAAVTKDEGNAADGLFSAAHYVLTDGIPVPSTQFIVHCDDVLGRNSGLDVVNRAEDESAARSQVGDPPTDFTPYVLRCSMRQHMLGVAPSAPERQPFSKESFEFCRILHSLSRDLNRVDGVHACGNQLFKEKARRPADVEQNLHVGFALDRSDQLPVGRDKDIVEDGFADEKALLVRHVAEHIKDLDVFACPIKRRRDESFVKFNEVFDNRSDQGRVYRKVDEKILPSHQGGDVIEKGRPDEKDDASVGLFIKSSCPIDETFEASRIIGVRPGESFNVLHLRPFEGA